MLCTSVVDQDPYDPMFWDLDPSLFVRRQIQIRILPSSSKIGSTTLISTVLCFLMTFYFWIPNDFSIPSESTVISKKTENFFVFGLLKVTDKKSRIWSESVVRIRGSGSVQKCHWSDPQHCFVHYVLVKTCGAVWVVCTARTYWYVMPFTVQWMSIGKHLRCCCAV